MYIYKGRRDVSLVANASMGEESDAVIIVGGGISGLATALALTRVGVKCLVLERSQSLRSQGAALALFPNAWKALHSLGVSHHLTPLFYHLQTITLTDVRTGAVQERRIRGDKTNDAWNPRTVTRRALLEALASELPSGTIRFSSNLKSVKPTEQGSSLITLQMEDGTTIKTKVLIGCDGVHSAVAKFLGLSDPVHSGRSAVRGLSNYAQGHGLEKKVQQFLDDGRRLGFTPIDDKQVYWFFTWNSGVKGEEIGHHPEDIKRRVIEWSEGIPQIFKDVVEHSELDTLSCAPLMLRVPWNVAFGELSRRGVTVAGDAMHPMTPDLGQGGCLAIEDAVVLGRHIGELVVKKGNFDEADEALAGYVKERRWRATRLIAGSYFSGWAQQAGSKSWWSKFLRDVLFYTLALPLLFNLADYDCGKLPSVPKLDKSD